jgi:SAM-dependent methyltransferase
MPTDNAEQIAEWNGVLGHNWATMRNDIDPVVAMFGDAALKVAAPRPGERVLDIGCGCGDTTFAIARIVGDRGSALGVDVSEPMLAVAREHAREAGLPHLEFRHADAAEAELPPGNDLLFSRFGVMFFSQPAAAFRHMRKSLRPGARCVFVCWRAPRNNAWAMAPLSAARAAMGVSPPPADPDAPGPFAFADDARVRRILADAGFEDIVFTRHDAPVAYGATPRAAAERALRVGPASRFARDMGDANLPRILEAVAQALAGLAGPDGQVKLVGSAWIVTANNPA